MPNPIPLQPALPEVQVSWDNYLTIWLGETDMLDIAPEVDVYEDGIFSIREGVAEGVRGTSVLPENYPLPPGVTPEQAAADPTLRYFGASSQGRTLDSYTSARIVARLIWFDDHQGNRQQGRHGHGGSQARRAHFEVVSKGTRAPHRQFFPVAFELVDSDYVVLSASGRVDLWSLHRDGAWTLEQESWGGPGA